MPNSKITYKDLYEIIDDFRKEVNGRFDNIEGCFVRQEEFRPVKSIAYGLVTLILGTVIGALIKLVVFAK